jgi:tetratricopeptide (TPR) repeat protein
MMAWKVINADIMLHRWRADMTAFRRTKDPPGVSLPWRIRSLHALAQERHGVRPRLTHARRAQHIRKEIADRMGEGTLLNNLGKIYDDLGRQEEAHVCYEQVLHILREIGNRPGEATALHNLGFRYQQGGQYDLAQRHYEESLRLRKEMGDRGGEGITLDNLGGVYSELGEEEKADGLPIDCV